MIIITVLLALTQFAAIIQLDSNKPEIIGNFRLMLTEPVRFNNRSEIQPPKRMPIAAARKGRGEEADVQPWKMALVGEVAGKPRQEKDQCGVAGELDLCWRRGSGDSPAGVWRHAS